MTGSIAQRVGIGGVMFPRNNHGLNPNEKTLPGLIKAQGYATAIIGKWHLGNQDMFQPLNHGFDTWYGTSTYGADTGLIDVGQAYAYRVVDPDAFVPPLVITRSGGNVILSWPATPVWSLWQSQPLGSGSWNPATVLTDDSHTHSVSAAPRMVFRLQK
jgi:hypothetical protein